MGNWHVKIQLDNFTTGAEALAVEATLDLLPCDGDVVPNIMYPFHPDGRDLPMVAASFVVAAPDAGGATVRALETVHSVTDEHIQIVRVETSEVSDGSAAAVLRIAQGRQAETA